MNPITVVFDLDDTLYPEHDYVRSGLAAAGQHAADQWGLTDFTATCLTLFSAGQRGDIFDQALAQHRVKADPALILALVAAYRAHVPQLRLHADANAVLHRLAGRTPLGLITDGPAAVQEAKITALGLASRLDAVICTDKLGGRTFWKPHPAAFEQMMRDLPARTYVYIADNPAKDFVAPNGLGWHTIQIVRAGGEYGDRPAAVGGEPQAIIHSLNALDIAALTLQHDAKVVLR
jgi:putative hydrolase of the HAD superfamily